jgi:MbtH protein
VSRFSVIRIPDSGRKPVANPFDDPDASYVALVNDEGQYSLWPAFVDVPAGWTVACPESDRTACLEFITARWTDMRPLSLIRAMADEPSATGRQEQE